jgi:hypothetical protein
MNWLQIESTDNVGRYFPAPLISLLKYQVSVESVLDILQKNQLPRSTPAQEERFTRRET